ncbi:MAG: amino acid ABC transporter permease [Firmicutes bacterium]|nr:amino acid ABC transporter permease [Bacillota bacterium]
MDGRSLDSSTVDDIMVLLSGSIPKDFLGGIIFIIQQNYQLYLEGIKYTLIISISGTILGLLLALFITVFRVQESDLRDSIMQRIVKRISVIVSSSYVEFFRGTPMIVQAAIFFYGLAMLGVRLPILLAGVIIVTLNTAAYLTEVLRAGINSIDKGQMEAARAIGLTRGQSFRFIIFPQAIKNMIPAIGNELVVNIKDSAVLSVIGVSELFYMGKSVAGTYYRYTESFVTVALIYLILVLITTRILTLIVRFTNSGNKMTFPSSQSVPVEVT